MRLPQSETNRLVAEGAADARYLLARAENPASAIPALIADAKARRFNATLAGDATTTARLSGLIGELEKAGRA